MNPEHFSDCSQNGGSPSLTPGIDFIESRTPFFSKSGT